MPDQLNRVFALARLFAVCSVLLIVSQIAPLPAAAAPARDDSELVSTPEDAGAEEAAETAEDAHEEIVAPASAEDEPAAESADEATAEPAHVEDEPAPEAALAGDEEPAPVHHEGAAEPAPVDVDDEVDDYFLRRLLDAINARRASAGTQPLTFIPARANAALESFLAETVPVISWPGPCGHHLVDGAFSWDYISATGFGGAPRGEVIACPGPEPYWTPDRTANQWWDSPIHYDVLYADGESNAIACSAYGVQDGSSGNGRKRGTSAEAASAVICVTFRG